MARNSNDLYSRSDGKAGCANSTSCADLRTFVTAYQTSLRVQEQLAQNRIRFSQRLQEMCEELNGLAREGEKQRKIVSQPVAELTGSTRRMARGTRAYCRRASRSWIRLARMMLVS